ncbi:MAG: nickel-dependent hydrogenase large subunit [Candidatus Hadarchaeales archaeon]
MEGEKNMTFMIPVGPQHPALKEPEFFKFEVRGEEVVDVDIRLGYAHRGIEEALARRSYRHGVYLAERICGICNVVHSTTYCQTIEELGGFEPPERAKYVRAVIMELERIHSHLLWLGVAAHEMGFDTLFMLAWRDREHIMDIREIISGGRIHSATNIVGGVRRDIKPEYLAKINERLKKVEKSVKGYINLWSSDRTILARCSGVGVLTASDAVKFSAVGPVARASGMDTDLRRDYCYGAYGSFSFSVPVERAGDVWARGMVRLRETMESIQIIRQALEKMPPGPVRREVDLRIQPNEAVGRTEAPRGELLYYVRSNGTDSPERVRIRTPTYGTFACLKPMFMGATVAEIPVVLWSIDPCFGCNDRITIVDAEKCETKTVALDELKRWSV